MVIQSHLRVRVAWKIALLLLTILPVLLLALLFGLTLTFRELDVSFLAAPFLWSLPVSFLTMLVYQYITFTDGSNVNSKALWSAALFLWFPLVGPVFWFLFVWKDAGRSLAGVRPGLGQG